MKYFAQIIYCCCVQIFLLPVLSSAQNNSSKADIQPYYYFNHTTVQQGLPTNNIQCVFKDSRGMLWIGTNESGLCKYDGYNYTTYTHSINDSTTIIANNAWYITEDKKANLWIGTLNGVSKYCYATDKFTNYAYGIVGNKRINLSQVMSFYEDSKGNKWLGTAGAGLFKFNERLQQFENYEPTSTLGLNEKIFRWVAKIYENTEREIVFSFLDGIITIDKNNTQHYIPLPNYKGVNPNAIRQQGNIMPLLKEYPNEIWYQVFGEGIFKYDKKARKWQQFAGDKNIPNNVIGKVCYWSKNEWLIGDHHLAVFNHRTGKYRRVFEELGYTFNDKFYDSETNTFWIASYRGIYSLNTNTQLCKQTASIPDWNANGVYYYDSVNGLLYSGTPYFSHHISAYNTITQQIKNYSIPYFEYKHLVCNNIYARNGIIYLNTHKGLWKYNTINNTYDSLIYKNDSLNTSRLGTLNFAATEKNIYSSGLIQNAFLQYNINSNSTALIALPKQIAHNRQPVNSYGIAASGNNVYIGFSEYDSIICYNELQKQFSCIALPQEILAKNYKHLNECLFIDKYHNLWCTSQQLGINIYSINNKKWIKHIGSTDGYTAAFCNQMIADSNGNIWANCNNGLYFFNAKDFSLQLFNTTTELSKDDAGTLLQLPYNHVGYTNVNTTKDVSFAILNASNRLNTTKAILIELSNLKVLEDNYKLDSNINVLGHLHFPALHNSFSLDYVGVNLTDEKNMQYAYLLTGIDKDWHLANRNHSLRYSNLSPGNYTLQIKAWSLHNPNATGLKSIQIHVAAAWYQAMLFKILVAATLLFLFFMIVRYYYLLQISKQKNIAEKQLAVSNERIRIATDIHDDMGAGISRIRFLGEKIKLKKQNKDVEEDVNNMINLSDELVDNMNEIIWTLKASNEPLQDVLYEIRRLSNKLLTDRDIEFESNIPEDIDEKLIATSAQKRNMYLLIKEAVHNAIKHSRASLLKLQVSINENELHIAVIDNGKGFDLDDAMSNGNGLYNFDKRIAAFNGNVNIQSGNTGTTIDFTIPMANFS